MATILIIDDEKLVRYAIRRHLEDEGHEVIEAEDGLTAFKFLEKSDPDLVITDILMPDQDGIEVIRELKERTPDIKIIAISGGGRIPNSAHILLSLAQDLGASKTLMKPINTADLTNMVDSCLTH